VLGLLAAKKNNIQNKQEKKLQGIDIVTFYL
jgi:hypothetical protein